MTQIENFFGLLAKKFEKIGNRIENLKAENLSWENFNIAINKQRNNLLKNLKDKLDNDLENINNAKKNLVANCDCGYYVDFNEINLIKDNFKRIHLKRKIYKLKHWDLLKISEFYDLFVFKKKRCSLKEYDKLRIRSNFENNMLKNYIFANNYIISFYDKFNDKNFLTIIELYDYNYKLIKKIKIDDECSFFKLVKSNDDFGLQKHSVDIDILVYEEKKFYDKPKLITLAVDQKPFHNLNSSRRPNINQLIHFNGSKLYIDDKIDTIYIFDRPDTSKWEHFKYNGEVKFDDVSRIYICLINNKILKSIEVRDLNGMILGCINNPKFTSFDFDRFGNVFLNKTLTDNAITYDEF